MDSTRGCYIMACRIYPAADFEYTDFSCLRQAFHPSSFADSVTGGLCDQISSRHSPNLRRHPSHPLDPLFFCFYKFRRPGQPLYSNFNNSIPLCNILKSCHSGLPVKAGSRT